MSTVHDKTSLSSASKEALTEWATNAIHDVSRGFYKPSSWFLRGSGGCHVSTPDGRSQWVARTVGENLVDLIDRIEAVSGDIGMNLDDPDANWDAVLPVPEPPEGFAEDDDQERNATAREILDDVRTRAENAKKERDALAEMRQAKEKLRELRKAASK